MGEDGCDEGEVRRSFRILSGGKLKMQQKISSGLLNLLQPVSLISECPRFHNLVRKTKNL